MKHSDVRAALGGSCDHAGRNASEHRAGPETRNAEADPPVQWGRLPPAGKRAARAPAGSAGVVMAARMEEGDGSNTGSPAGGAHTPTGTPRGAGRAGRVADGLVIPQKPGNAGAGKEPWFESSTEREQGVVTGESLTGPDKVRKLQTVLHAKAKEEPDRRFHALIDKVWRTDFLMEAWAQVRRKGGSAGVDGETVTSVESYGVDRWLGELARDLKDGTYEPKPVRQVLIPKKQPGKYRPLGIPCIRDRVAQTSAMLVLTPIFEADLQPEQYAYRPERSAHDAVKRVDRLVYTGHNEVVDCDLSNYFGEIPHAELTKSLARRISDGRMLALIKAWLFDTRYWDFTAKHFREKLVAEHDVERSYNWVRLTLQAHGRMRPAPRRGAHRRKRPRRALAGMTVHQDGSRHEWVPGPLVCCSARVFDAGRHCNLLNKLDSRGSRFDALLTTNG